MNFKVVKAKESDWEDAMALAYRVFMEFESEEYGEEGTKSFLDFVSCQKLKKMFLIGEYHMMVVKEKEKIVGMISLRSGNHISLLFVDSHYHRKGIGKLLIEALVEYLKSETRYQTITVNASPYGLPFYQNFGFEKTGQQIQTEGIIYTPMECSFKKS